VTDLDADDLDRKPALVLVDGEHQTPISAYALAVALFATVPDALKGTVIALTIAFTKELDQGKTISIQANRVATASGPLVQP
jgi:hypothetical protein